MNKTATLSIADYFLEIGNQFFNLDEEDWTFAQDDLNYETTDRTGFNGYVLKFEETADGYTNSFRSYLVMAFNWLTSLITGKKEALDTDKVQSESNNKRFGSAQFAIRNKVRSRLLDVINEDVEIWNKQNSVNGHRKAHHIHKNQFKTDLESSVIKQKSIFGGLGFMKSLMGKE
jgi:hypothetical protein